MFHAGRYYRLDALDRPVRVDFEDADFSKRWQLCSYPTENVKVSTIFTARDTHFVIAAYQGPPIVFETMVFEVTAENLVDLDAEKTHPWNEYQEHYTTKRRAENGHAIICAAIKNGQVPDDLQGAWGVDPGLM